ncbi:MAG TPA: hypothetical protein VFI95_05245 [Terriglobales bacterium]|nr:hypothetical protein [Terriglobales bacterium]
MGEDAGRPRDWHEIAEQASHEKDPEKLLELTRQLTDAFDRQNRKPMTTAEEPPRPQKSAIGTK